MSQDLPLHRRHPFHIVECGVHTPLYTSRSPTVDLWRERAASQVDVLAGLPRPIDLSLSSC